MIKNNETLLATEEIWKTTLGKFFPGERVVYRNKDLFSELSDITWMGLLVYGITGRIYQDKQLRLFEGLWTHAISYPDPRLWNNRIAALAGTARSTATLATSAATAVTEAEVYGHRANVRAIDFLYRLKERVESGESLEEVVRHEIKKYRGILGYGRPLVSSDERIEPVMKLARELGLDGGEFVRLAFEVDRILREGRWRMQMNVTGLAAALSADQGLSVREYAAIIVTGFSAGITPCYVDAMSHDEGTFFPLRVTRLQYKGSIPRRVWEKEQE